jgi:hypothetical protein
MRLTSLFALVSGLTLSPLALAAQDDADTSVVADDTVAVSDTVEPRRPIRRPPGGNPYLREVRESRSHRRGPMYASFGLGLGSEAIADLGAPAPYSPSRVRPTLSIGLGANVGQALRVGFDGFAWFNLTNDGAVETVTAAMLGGRFYPIPSSGLYLRAAGGFGRYGIDVTDDCGCSTALVSDYGLAYALGAGFEVPVGRGLWLGPSLEMVRIDITGPGGYRERVLNFGITLTYDGPSRE